jgi:hypothetical protein
LKKIQCNIIFPIPYILLLKLKITKATYLSLTHLRNCLVFFKQDDHRPNLKESKLLNKIKLKAEKIAGHDLCQAKLKLTTAAQKNKALYLASLEGHFLEKLFKNLTKK